MISAESTKTETLTQERKSNGDKYIQPQNSSLLFLSFGGGFVCYFQHVQEAAATAPAPATAPATTATGDGGAAAAAAAEEAATAAAAAVTATERAAAAEAARLAKRVERFGRIAPVTETEAAEKLAKRREKFGLPEPVGVQFAWYVYVRTYSTRSCVRATGRRRGWVSAWACPRTRKRFARAPATCSFTQSFFFCGGPS